MGAGRGAPRGGHGRGAHHPLHGRGRAPLGRAARPPRGARRGPRDDRRRARGPARRARAGGAARRSGAGGGGRGAGRARRDDLVRARRSPGAGDGRAARRARRGAPRRAPPGAAAEPRRPLPPARRRERRVSALLALFDWRAFAVFRRNALVYLRNWRTAFLPPAMEPVVYFVALGLGLRGFVGGVDVGGGQVVDYATYVAPGLIAYTAFTTPFYEALYSAYVRMFYQKTWDGILATQVELPHLVWGEVLWAAARGFMNASVVAVVLAIFAAFGTVDVHLAWLPALPLLGLWAGLCFGAFALIFTALVPAIDHMNYPVFLIGVPLSLASNTYFPVSSDVAALQVLIELNPVYQLAESCRGLLVRGAPDAHLWKLFATSGGLLVLLTPLAVALTRRRVLS
ncbi:MAG: hypothetical protein CMN31_14760 [Sandaracinus sp.]|nr:hypothetical protein [Sandaracinus sp.]MBJ72574.1 hypothetical protein [Sandaracinus sp.]